MKPPTLNLLAISIALLAQGHLDGMMKKRVENLPLENTAIGSAFKKPGARLSKQPERPYVISAQTILQPQAPKSQSPSRQQLSPLSPTHEAISLSQSIKINFQNFLPEGALIRKIYKKEGSDIPIFVDKIIKLPEDHQEKISVIMTQDGVLLKLIGIQAVDLGTNTIVEEVSKRELQKDSAPENIVLMRTKKQLPQLDIVATQPKQLRFSPLFIPVLSTIDENETSDSQSERTTVISPSSSKISSPTSPLSPTNRIFQTSPTFSRGPFFSISPTLRHSSSFSTLEPLPKDLESQPENSDNFSEDSEEKILQKEPESIKKTLPALVLPKEPKIIQPLYNPTEIEKLMGLKAHQRRKQLTPLTNIPLIKDK